MKLFHLPIEIPEGERTALVNWLVNLVAEQQEIIREQQERIAKLEEKVNSLDEELKVAKKLKGKPKIRPSTLNQEQKNQKKTGKRAGSEKRSKKLNFEVDEGGTAEDFVLNEYSRSYLEQQKLPACHLCKLKFDSQIISNSDREWSQYLQQLGITSQQGIKLLTEAGLLGSAIEHGLSPELIVLSDGAKQFALLVHALCWVHRSRSLRRLHGVTAQQRREIEQVQDALWSYYRELKAYQLQPTPQDQTRLELRFDEIFEPRYPHHYGLNLALYQFSSHKDELLRVLDFPQLPLHPNAAETDIREYVTRRKISGGTRHDHGRQARDTFTGLKKTCRKLALSFWQYLLSRFTGDRTVPYLPDVIRALAAAPT